MYSPITFEIILDYPELNREIVEFEILKKLKQKYKFKATEIFEDKVELRDAFPHIYRCEFNRNTITLTLLDITKENNALKDLCYILNEHLNFADIRLKKLELIGLFKIVNSNKILNLNLQDNDVSNFEIEFTTKNTDSDETKVSFIYDKADDRNLAVISLSPNKKAIDMDQFIEYLEKKKNELIKAMVDYCTTPEENIIFPKTEVVRSE